MEKQNTPKEEDDAESEQLTSTEGNPSQESGYSADETIGEDSQDSTQKTDSTLAAFREVVTVVRGLRYSSPRRWARDASTNTVKVTTFGGFMDHVLREGAGSEGSISTRTNRCLAGLLSYHRRLLNLIPSLRKFCFCVPLHYGVYTIVSSEQIFFFLRGYTRVLHLAMPSCFPQLLPWTATLELLLCGLVLASGPFLLAGAYFDSDYMIVWIDIHIFEIAVYIYLIIYLSLSRSECVFDCTVVYFVIIIVFVYFIMVVNSYRKAWVGPEPVELSSDIHEV